jgi:hypothetical protein
MLSKCANPGCPAVFLYLHQGKLFRLEAATNGPASPATRKSPRRVEFFWLCEACAASLTLGYSEGGEITIVPAQRGQTPLMLASGGGLTRGAALPKRPFRAT